MILELDQVYHWVAETVLPATEERKWAKNQSFDCICEDVDRVLEMVDAVEPDSEGPGWFVHAVKP